MKQSIFTVKSNQHLTDTVLKMVLAGDTSAITASGQFVNIKLDGFSCVVPFLYVTTTKKP